MGYTCILSLGLLPSVWTQMDIQGAYPKTWVRVSSPALFSPPRRWGGEQGMWALRGMGHVPTCLLLRSALEHATGHICPPQCTNCRGTRAWWGLQTHSQGQVTKLFPKAHQVTINPLFLEKCPLWKVSSSSLWGGSWWEWSRAKKAYLSSSHLSESSCHFTEWKGTFVLSQFLIYSCQAGHLLTIT